ncbi:MAG TPA: peptidoglycan editing factor PgeF [Bacteroidota bacterium]|nr:peptidoglycan editing factor PgeF [Bacteroidota bacterium]
MIIPEIFQSFPHIRAAVSTRGEVSPARPFGMNMSYTVGDSYENVERSRRQFFSSLGIDAASLAIPQQIHSKNIQIIEAPAIYPDCDGLITRSTDVALVITVADCLPILLFDPQHDVLAAVHAGWRGTVAQIAMNAVEQLVKTYGSHPKDVLAFIGPGAGNCCYEVGDEVVSQVQHQFVVLRHGKRFLDLKKINFHQLLEIGVQKQHIELCRHCTICEPEIFHSYRRDKTRSGRMMATIVMRKHKQLEI